MIGDVIFFSKNPKTETPSSNHWSIIVMHGINWVFVWFNHVNQQMLTSCPLLVESLLTVLLASFLPNLLMELALRMSFSVVLLMGMVPSGHDSLLSPHSWNVSVSLSADTFRCGLSSGGSWQRNFKMSIKSVWSKSDSSSFMTWKEALPSVCRSQWEQLQPFLENERKKWNSL